MSTQKNSINVQYTYKDIAQAHKFAIALRTTASIGHR